MAPVPVVPAVATTATGTAPAPVLYNSLAQRIRNHLTPPTRRDRNDARLGNSRDEGGTSNREMSGLRRVNSRLAELTIRKRPAAGQHQSLQRRETTARQYHSFGIWREPKHLQKYSHHLRFTRGHRGALMKRAAVVVERRNEQVRQRSCGKR